MDVLASHRRLVGDHRGDTEGLGHVRRPGEAKDVTGDRAPRLHPMVRSSSTACSARCAREATPRRHATKRVTLAKYDARQAAVGSRGAHTNFPTPTPDQGLRPRDERKAFP